MPKGVAAHTILLMHLFQQMQWPFLILILALALVLAQSISMKFSVLAVKPTLLTVLEALLSAVLLYTHTQEYDVKVWKMINYCCPDLLKIIIVKGNIEQ